VAEQVWIQPIDTGRAAAAAAGGPTEKLVESVRSFEI